MEYSIKQQTPYIIAECIVCIMLNFGLKECFILSESLWTIPIVIASLAFVRWVPRTDSEFAIKNVFRKYLPPMIYMPLAMCGWQYYTYKHITLWQVPMVFLCCMLIFVIMEKSLYD